METTYYILSPAPHPWGDYANVLFHGLGPLGKGARLERTGPFIPQLTIPGWDVVVTDEFRKDLKESGLTGLSFRPVVKFKIVELNWHEWDLKAARPMVRPREGEPENYVEFGAHSAEAARRMGRLWTLDIPAIARARSEQGEDELLPRVFLQVETTQNLDFVRSPNNRCTFISDRSRKWLQERVGEWVEFQPVHPWK